MNTYTYSFSYPCSDSYSYSYTYTSTHTRMHTRTYTYTYARSTCAQGPNKPTRSEPRHAGAPLAVLALSGPVSGRAENLLEKVP